MSLPSGSDPRDPNTILATCQRAFQRFTEQLPDLRSALWELPSRTFERYVERDRRYDARQGPIGDPFKGFIDPGLADGIDERRQRYEEYLRKKREEKEKEERKSDGSDDA